MGWLYTFVLRCVFIRLNELRFQLITYSCVGLCLYSYSYANVCVCIFSTLSRIRYSSSFVIEWRGNSSIGSSHSSFINGFIATNLNCCIAVGAAVSAAGLRDNDDDDEHVDGVGSQCKRLQCFKSTPILCSPNDIL